MALTRNQIKKTRKREWLPVPAWTPEGETHDPAKHGIWVAAMGARAALAYEDQIQSKYGDGNTLSPAAQAELFALVCMFSAEDDDGIALFTDADIPWLVNESLDTLSPIFETTMRLSGMTQKAEVERSKNLEAGAGDDSLSCLPAISA